MPGIRASMRAIPTGGIITGGNMKETGSGAAAAEFQVLNGGEFEMKGGTIYRNRTSGSAWRNLELLHPYDL